MGTGKKKSERVGVKDNGKMEERGEKLRRYIKDQQLSPSPLLQLSIVYFQILHVNRRERNGKSKRG